MYKSDTSIILIFHEFICIRLDTMVIQSDGLDAVVLFKDEDLKTNVEGYRFDWYVLMRHITLLLYLGFELLN